MYLIILGAVPPPRGGVTTHIERLLPYLDDEGISFVVWDHSKVLKNNSKVISLRRSPLKLLAHLFKKNKVLHCPISSISFRKALFLLILKIAGVKITITLVASTKIALGEDLEKLKILLAVVRFSSHLFILNNDLRNLLLAKDVCKEKMSLIQGFIPIKEEILKKQIVPREIIEFCQNTTPTLITYAHGPDIYQGQDLYGIDLVIELAQKMRNNHPRLGVLVLIPEVTNIEYFNKIKILIASAKLETFFYFAVGLDIPFVATLEHVDINIRATNTDGDALTVREAEYYNVHSVASDVVQRPEATFLFQNRNSDDLFRIVNKLATKGKLCQSAKGMSQKNNVFDYISVFKRIASKKESRDGRQNK